MNEQDNIKDFTDIFLKEKYRLQNSLFSCIQKRIKKFEERTGFNIKALNTSFISTQTMSDTEPHFILSTVVAKLKELE
jgi:hypothetical protein